MARFIHLCSLPVARFEGALEGAGDLVSKNRSRRWRFWGVFLRNLGEFFVLILIEVIYCGFWLRSFFWGTSPIVDLFVINSFLDQKEDLQNKWWRNLAGFFFWKKCWFQHFSLKAFPICFFIWKEKNLEQSPGFLPQKSSAADFFFFGWLLRPATEVDRSFARWGEFEETRAFFLAEFWVLSFEFWLRVVSFLFAEKKTQLMVNLLVWGPVVWIRAGIF